MLPQKFKTQPYFPIYVILGLVTAVIIFGYTDYRDSKNMQEMVLETVPNNDTSVETLQSKKPEDIMNYTVMEGDTLESVAKKFAISTKTIMLANHLRSSELSVGQQMLILPVDGILYTVKDGDTIESIAQKYKVPPENIINWPYNDILEMNDLPVGKDILVPGAF